MKKQFTEMNNSTREAVLQMQTILCCRFYLGAYTDLQSCTIENYHLFKEPLSMYLRRRFGHRTLSPVNGWQGPFLAGSPS